MVVEANFLAQGSVGSFEGDAGTGAMLGEGSRKQKGLQFSSKSRLSIGEVFSLSSSHPSTAP